MENLLQALGKTEADYLRQLLSDPIKRIQQFSDVELTEGEIAEALISAKSKKHTSQEYERAEQYRRKKYQELIEPFDTDKLNRFCHEFYCKRFDKKFIVDSGNSILLHKLTQYFTGSREFESDGYSLKKGILIQGNVGVGKTEIMRFFQKNKKCCYRIVSCADIADEYLTYGDEIEGVYSTPTERAINDPDVFFQKYTGTCFDDLGTEEIKNNFGNKKNVMADILMAIYDKKDYSKFHITTNLDPNEIEERYGTRVRSRMREMFNIFILQGADRRG
jgi:DNA replication protein DnaC